LFRRRVFSGETLMSINKGIENGLATAAMSPSEFAPTSQQQLQWPQWGQYYETKGKAGETPNLPSATRLKELYEDWLSTALQPDQSRIWHAMLQIWADETFSIGTVAGVLQPVVVSEKLHNVPEEGFYNWDPGAFFGVFKPDTFWLDTSDTHAKSASSDASPPVRP
jgi:peptide/nickel transport system substrate-binding protein